MSSGKKRRDGKSKPVKRKSTCMSNQTASTGLTKSTKLTAEAEVVNSRTKVNCSNFSKVQWEYVTYLEVETDEILPDGSKKRQLEAFRFAFDQILDFKKVGILDEGGSAKAYYIAFVAIKPTIVEFSSLPVGVQAKVLQMIRNPTKHVTDSVDDHVDVAPEGNLPITGDIYKSIQPQPDLVQTANDLNPVGHVLVQYYPFPVNINNFSAPALHAILNMYREGKFGKMKSIYHLHDYFGDLNSSNSSTVSNKFMYVHYYYNWATMFMNFYLPEFFTTRYYPDNYNLNISESFRLQMEKDRETLSELEANTEMKYLLIDYKLKSEHKSQVYLNFYENDCIGLKDINMGKDTYLSHSEWRDVTRCVNSEQRSKYFQELEISRSNSSVPHPTSLKLITGLDQHSYLHNNIKHIKCPDCVFPRYYSEGHSRLNHMRRYHMDLKPACPHCKVENLYWIFNGEMDRHFTKSHQAKAKQCLHCSQFFSTQVRMLNHFMTCKLLPQNMSLVKQTLAIPYSGTFVNEMVNVEPIPFQPSQPSLNFETPCPNNQKVAALPPENIDYSFPFTPESAKKTNDQDSDADVISNSEYIYPE